MAVSTIYSYPTTYKNKCTCKQTYIHHSDGYTNAELGSVQTSTHPFVIAHIWLRSFKQTNKQTNKTKNVSIGESPFLQNSLLLSVHMSCQLGKINFWENLNFLLPTTDEFHLSASLFIRVPCLFVSVLRAILPPTPPPSEACYIMSKHHSLVIWQGWITANHIQTWLPVTSCHYNVHWFTYSESRSPEVLRTCKQQRNGRKFLCVLSFLSVHISVSVRDQRKVHSHYNKTNLGSHFRRPLHNPYALFNM
jgi:hypothetical protein